MKIKKTLIFIILLLCVTLLSQRYIKVSSLPETGVVKEVIDGDTVRLSSGRLVRYLGIDTPEIRSKKGETWEYKPKPYAVEAKKFNEKLVKGKRIRIKLDEEKVDKYGRVLAYVYPLKKKSDFKSKKGFLETVESYLNFLKDNEYKMEEMVNAQILKKGYGVIYIKPPNLKYINQLVNAQEIAIKQRMGIWDKANISPKEAKEYMGETVIVEGRLKNMINKGEVVILKFEKRTNFELVIFKSNLVLFRKNKELINEYLDRFVKVYGIVEEYKGTPQIVINHPCQLEILK